MDLLFIHLRLDYDVEFLIVYFEYFEYNVSLLFLVFLLVLIGKQKKDCDLDFDKLIVFEELFIFNFLIII